MRLDLFLTQQVPGCSRRTAQRAIAAGEVRINGRRARKGDRVSADDQLQVTEELYAPPVLQPNPQLALHVLYEDDAVIVVDKPAGMPSHALRAHESDTVANFLLARDPDLARIGNGDREAGLVHRLDTDTSGVLLAARTTAAHRALRQQFALHQVLKEYLVLVEGRVAAPGVVRTPIAHDRHNRRKMRVALRPEPGAREAVTHFRPIEAWDDRTLLVVQIPTGVTHQIRVHLASIGHPIVGDRLYGSATQVAPRQLLHAAKLCFAHPTTGEPMQISSPLPTDFTKVLNRGKRAQAAGTG
jgi:23S rRNA pseudouridine1911/1915/1917 synthase